VAVAVAEAIAMAGAVPETVWGMVSVCGLGCGCGCGFVAVGAGRWVPGGCWVVGFVGEWVGGWVGGWMRHDTQARPRGSKNGPILGSNF